MQSLFDDENDKETDAGPGEKPAENKPFVLSSTYAQPTAGETVRRNGLAWSAGIAFFGAIVFMLFLGWIADQVLGSSPWGVVGGIVLGSIIGFLQFFRITSQIFNKNNAAPAEHPLMSPAADATTERRDRFDEH